MVLPVKLVKASGHCPVRMFDLWLLKRFGSVVGVGAVHGDGVRAVAVKERIGKVVGEDVGFVLGDGNEPLVGKGRR